MINVYGKIATGAKAVGVKATKVAGAIDKACKGIAWHMTYKELRALDKSHKHMKSDMVVLKCRMERNEVKMAVLRKSLN